MKVEVSGRKWTSFPNRKWVQSFEGTWYSVQVDGEEVIRRRAVGKLLITGEQLTKREKETLIGG